MEKLPILDEDFHNSGLPIKQERFCELLVDPVKPRSAGQAYMGAGYQVKNVNIASAAANRLLKKVKVQDFIKYLRQKAIDQTIADLVEVKQTATEILRGRMSQYVEMDENGRAAVKPDSVSLGSAAVAEITTESVNIGGKKNPLTADNTKFKLRDPIPAARLLGELSGWVKDGGINFNFNQNNMEAKVVVFDSKQTAQTVIEAIRLGIGPELFGQAGDGEAAPVLPASANPKAVTLPST